MNKKSKIFLISVLFAIPAFAVGPEELQKQSSKQTDDKKKPNLDSPHLQETPQKLGSNKPITNGGKAAVTKTLDLNKKVNDLR